MEKDTDKRERIIQAAVQVLKKKNFQNMKISDVAKEAGVADGTVYLYIENKQELLLESLQYCHDILVKNMLSGISEQNSVEENLMTLGQNFYLQNKEITDIYKVVYKSYSEVENKDVQQVLARFYEESVDEVRMLLEKCVERENRKIPSENLELMTMIMWGLGDMIWKRTVIAKKKADYRHEMERIVGLVMKFII